MNHLSALIAQEETASGSAAFQFVLLAAVPLALYFLMIRPQRRKMREAAEMQASLAVGDEVITGSGIYGFITAVEDDLFWIEVDEDVQLRVVKSQVHGRVSGQGGTGSGRRRSGCVGRIVSSRRLRWSLFVFVIAVATLLGVNLGTGDQPILGLDLQGGVSVILQSTDEASADNLLVVQDLIRDELETLGIAEPDVRVEGSNIVVDLPGVKDQEEALEAVDVAGIVTLRPVLACQAGVTPADLGDQLPEGTGAFITADGLQTCILGPSGVRARCLSEEVPKPRSISSPISGSCRSTSAVTASRSGTLLQRSVTQRQSRAQLASSRSSSTTSSSRRRR